MVDYVNDGQSLDYLTPGEPLIDPVGPQVGSEKALRGGAFYKDGCYVNASWHSSASPYMRRYDTGFRPVRTLLEESESDSKNGATSD